MLNRICALLSTALSVLGNPAITSVAGYLGADMVVCGGSVIEITGTYFFGPHESISVTVNGNACTSVVRPSSTKIRCVLPLGAAHGVAYDVVVTTLGGSDTLVGGLTYVPSPLVFSSVYPPSGGETEAVTISGTGFLDADDVLGNGFSLAIWAIVNDRTITVTVEPQGPPSPYVATLSVYDADVPAQVDGSYYVGTDIASVTPSSGPVTGGTPLVIMGQGFYDATDVLFEGQGGSGPVSCSGFVVISDSEIHCTAPNWSAPNTFTGNVTLTVVTSGHGSPTFAAAYVYDHNTLAITSVTPDNGFDGTHVVVIGTGLTGLVPNMNLSAVDNLVRVDDTQLSFDVPVGLSPGYNDLAIGWGVGPGQIIHTPFAVGPTVDLCTPDNGPITGGTSVTITGKGFANVSDVQFYGLSGLGDPPISASSIVVVDPSTITCVTPDWSSGPSGLSGGGGIILVDPNGSFDDGGGGVHWTFNP